MTELTPQLQSPVLPLQQAAFLLPLPLILMIQFLLIISFEVLLPISEEF
jgi:hypothetical protein